MNAELENMIVAMRELVIKLNNEITEENDPERADELRRKAEAVKILADHTEVDLIRSAELDRKLAALGLSDETNGQTH